MGPANHPHYSRLKKKIQKTTCVKIPTISSSDRLDPSLTITRRDVRARRPRAQDVGHRGDDRHDENENEGA